MDLLDGFITTTSTARLGANLDLFMQGGADVSIPNFVPWIGGTPLVGGQFLLNYVNDLDLSNDFVAGWGTLGGKAFGLRVRLDGNWDFLGAKEIAAYTPPAEGEAAPYGQSYLIGPETDWTMFFVEWENASPGVELELETPGGVVLNEDDIAAAPSMTMVTELSNDQRKVVRVDLPEAGLWRVGVTDTTDLGTVDTTAMASQDLPSIGVTSVSSGLLREPVDVQVAVSDPESQTLVSLFYDTDDQDLDGVMIADGLVASGGLVDYTWDTAGVAAGDYFLYARAIDDVNPPVYAYSAAAVEITDRLPEVTSLSATPDPVIRPGDATLTAEVVVQPGDEIVQVEFYRDTTLLGADADGSDGWTWTGSTAGWTFGEETLSARAQSIGGTWSEPSSTAVTVEDALPGDATLDRIVNDLDVSLLAGHWQQQAGADWGDGDFNGDGKVDDLDVSLLALNWQQTLEAAVPEAAPAVEPLGATLVDTAMVGPRQVTVSGARRALEPLRGKGVRYHLCEAPFGPLGQLEPAPFSPEAHDAALAEEYGEAELTQYRLAWSLEFARTRGPERPADRPGPARRTLDLVLATGGMTERY